MFFWLFLLFWFVSPAVSGAELLTEAGIYHRCHAQFTRVRPKAGDPLLHAVKAGEQKGAEACARLLDGFSLPGLVPPGKRGVFNAFLAFHASWFPLRDFLLNGTEAASFDYYDANEMAYHLNVVLFDGGRFDEIVTGSRTYVAERNSKREALYFAEPDFRGQFRKLIRQPWKIDGGKAWNPAMVERGEIVAIRPRKEGGPAPVKSEKGSYTLSSKGTYGGGLLGTDTYLILNSNQSPFDPSDNENASHRRWAKSVMRDLLCREIPAVRLADAEPFVSKKSKVPFRRSAECMSCHATMDPLADGIRHIMEIRPGGKMGFDFEPRILGSFKADRAQTATVDPDPEFHRRPPQGRLYFRSFSGELVDRNFSDLDSLGRHLADTDDLYLCAARRYFHFMTGIEVKVADYSEIPMAVADPKSGKYLAFVKELAFELKRHQSLKKMVSSILSSKYYSQVDYGANE